jgi:hypothetical protein
MIGLTNHVVWMPIVLFLVSMAGLVTALLGDGWWNLAASILLALPIFYALKAFTFKRNYGEK